MTNSITDLLENNSRWAANVSEGDPSFFKKLAGQQSPKFLWIGCSDSRVPANVITGLAPGEVFVHRNVSNRVENTDRNILAVLQFAILSLKVEHIIVCGHHDCGGVKAALTRSTEGPLCEWVSPIRMVAIDNQADESKFSTQEEWVNKVCELNVQDQIETLLQNQYLKEAATLGQKVSVHGWVYSLQNGLIKDLGVSASNLD